MSSQDPEPSAPGDAPSEPPARPPVSRLWWVSGPVGLTTVIVIIVLLVRSTPYVVFVPGSATPVEPLIGVEAQPGEPEPELDDVGEHILFTTVSVEYPTGALVLRRTVDDDADIAPAQQYFGTQTQEENRQYNAALMTDSKDKATKVALEALGHEIETLEVGAVVLDVDPSYPAAEVLRPGDTITDANGEPVHTSDDLAEHIQSHEPGEDLELTLTRLGEESEETVRARLAEHADDPDRPQLGVTLTTRPEFEFPFEITIETEDVGGPSAGLAFTLALIDLLSSGDLTGGEIVAVTGTIELDGTVGPVGGVRQKVEAATRKGAQFFLVPPQELDEARRSAGDRLEVIAVSNLDEALEALRDIGGDPVEAAEDGGG